MNGRIFISYRRGDDPGASGRLFDRLQDAFAPDQLFMDVDSIAPGLDYVRVLQEQVAECDVLLAVIGKGWIDARDAAGARRLDSPDDFVRIEIESALDQGKRVIPVLVGEAHMPAVAELPETLKPLARRNAVRLTHERFRSDTEGLVKALQKVLNDVEVLRQYEAVALRLEEELKAATEHATDLQESENKPQPPERHDQPQAGAEEDAYLRSKQPFKFAKPAEPSQPFKFAKPVKPRLFAAGAILIGALIVLIWAIISLNISDEQEAASTEPQRSTTAQARATPQATPEKATPQHTPPEKAPAQETTPEKVRPSIVPRSVKTVTIPGQNPQSNRPTGADNSQPVSGYVVYLTSNDTEEGARATFRDLQQQYPSVLGTHQLFLWRAALGQRGTFYRVEVGPFPKRELADQLCAALKAAGGRCIVMNAALN